MAGTGLQPDAARAGGEHRPAQPRCEPAARPAPVDQSDRFADVIETRIRRAVRRFRENARGIHARHCPLCGYYGTFTPFGHNPRIDAQCAKCGSLERHRQIMLLMTRRDIFRPEHRVLHFAPERELRVAIRRRCGEYVAADLMREDVDLRLNIEAMDLPDAGFDRVVCNHVLEHVDDRKALAEIRRILKPGGIALLSTPLIEGWDATYENDSIDGAAMRVLHFGQEDHVRYYGRDLRRRIIESGFLLEDMVATEPDVSTYGLVRGECIFLATRPGE